MSNEPKCDNVRELAERYITACSEYTDTYEREKLIRDWMGKEALAKAVVGDFERRAGPVRGHSVLDVGFGNGLYMVAFARAGAEVVGLEVNPVLADIAREAAASAGISADIRTYDSVIFPFGDNSFDHAFSISVLEHVSDAPSHLQEISRVLKPGGKLYLSFPNRFAPRESHTGIWFLSYVPRFVAAAAVRTIWHRNTVEELNMHFLSYFSLLRLLRRTDLRVRMEYGGASFPRRFARRVLGCVGIHHSAILRTVMVIVEKKSQ